MKRPLRILVWIVFLLVVFAGIGAGGVWWVAWRALPQLDGTASLPGLGSEVTVDRDSWGVPHIRAKSAEDLALAQGYVVAQDRLWQMDVLRRAAAGELSEIFGPIALEVDREARILGMRQAAERAAAETDPAVRLLIEAYARGVNRYIEERRGRLPWEFVALRYEPRPWTAADSYLVGALMFQTLTSTWEAELARAKIIARMGPQLAAELYAVDSPRDRFVVGETETHAAMPARAPSPETRLWGEAQGFFSRFGSDHDAVFGSNNWVVSDAHSYSGKPLLANDMHLRLEIPPIWYIVQLTAPGWNVKGFALPGVPFVVAGHNERIAWGFTNNGADVQDLYIETFNRQNPAEYRANGQWVRAELRKEAIKVKGRPDHTLDVVLTRHGPIVHRDAGKAYALRWTALEPGGLSFAIPLLGRARNWQEFLDVARKVSGPAQNVVYADVDGNIGYVMPAWVPVRRSGDGSVPMPGETDAFDWTGYIPFEELPRVLNPPSGIIATANARVVGPGYKPYLTDRWAGPQRTERIYELLEQGKKFRPDDFVTIQADVTSGFHRMLAGYFVQAAEQAKPKDARTAQLLARLKGWGGVASADSVETAFVEYARRALLRNLLRPHLGDEGNRLYQWWRHVVFTENVLRTRPPQWLPKEYASYDELLMASADEAVKQLEQASGSATPSDWNWGRFIRLEINHPIGRSGILQRLLSIGPMEQPGTGHTVKQTGRSVGPSERAVYDVADWDKSLMNLPAGQSGQWLSPHYRDHFPAWFEGRGLPAPFSNSAVDAARKHRLMLKPAS